MRLFGVAAIFAMLMLVLPLSGCGLTTQEANERIGQLQKVVDTSVDAIDTAQGKRDSLEKLVGYLPEGDLRESALKAIADTDAFITEHRAKVTQAQEAIAAVKSETASASTWGEFAGGTAGAVAPFLPPPWNAVVGAAGAALAWFLGKRRGDQNAVKLASSIERARREVPELDTGLKAASTNLLSAQDDTVRKIVNRAQLKT